jgi:hypothetical protein
VSLGDVSLVYIHYEKLDGVREEKGEQQDKYSGRQCSRYPPQKKTSFPTCAHDSVLTFFCCIFHS